MLRSMSIDWMIFERNRARRKIEESGGINQGVAKPMQCATGKLDSVNISLKQGAEG